MEFDFVDGKGGVSSFAPMKVWIPALAALVVVATLISARHSQIAGIERQTVALRERVELALAPRDLDGLGPVSLAERRAQQQAGAQPTTEATGTGVDWKDFAERMVRARSLNMPDLRLHMKMQKALIGLDPDQFAVALDEIEALDLGGEEQKAVREAVMIGLILKDPGQAVDQFFSHDLNRRPSERSLVNDAFEKWLAKDATEAQAWLDRKIAAGGMEAPSLDGSQWARAS